ncbi:MAG TPA: DUF3267 domain-containing protein [Bacteroidetes bacterium]|nr:DUF3267 domain-containing protein [Bacteroidota bacterium]
MGYKVDDIIKNDRFRHLYTLSYDDIIPFVFKYIKKHTFPIILAWSFLLAVIIWMIDFRFALAGNFRFLYILMHSFIGFIVIPMLLVIPHEFLHIVPYFLGGARNIRVGADWKQYYFYVTSHLYPVGPFLFITVALTPFILISAGLIYLVCILQSPLWTWSLLCTLFMHTTMSAGDFALINFYWTNRDRKIVTWDDADRKESYFYEETNEER